MNGELFCECRGCEARSAPVEKDFCFRCDDYECEHLLEARTSAIRLWNTRPLEDAKDAELANLKAENARLTGTVEHLRAFCLNPHEHEDGACDACNGIGSRMYANTATWRGGLGGSAMTTGVCNKCWGSGSQDKPWPSWRAIEGDRRNAHRVSEERTALEAENARLRDSIDRATETLAQTSERAIAAETGIARLREAGRWIPVGEKLPEQLAKVLTTDGEWISIAWVDPREGWQHIDECNHAVTHWMPLPAPEAQP
jgi:cell division protein FtsB